MKQIESLGNACGTVALLHAIGNASSEVNLGNQKQLYMQHTEFCKMMIVIFIIFVILSLFLN